MILNHKSDIKFMEVIRNIISCTVIEAGWELIAVDWFYLGIDFCRLTGSWGPAILFHHDIAGFSWDKNDFFWRSWWQD